MGEKSVLENLIGKKFGRLEVITQAPSRVYRNKKKIYWYVVCDCNKEKMFSVRATSLKNGDTQSCGCLHREAVSKPKKINFYEKDNELECIKLYNQEHTQFCLIDEEDIPKLQNKYWKQDQHGYWANDTINSHIYIQDIIMGSKKGEVVDHIYGIKYDNRKKYLRICTHQQNCFNKRIYTKNSSGFMGVTWDKSRDKWVSQLCYNGKHYNIGRFENKQDAIKARLKGELKYFGKDFAPQRHLFTEYNINTEVNPDEN